MYRDEIFLKLNKHTGFNKHTGVVHFAQNRKKHTILEKIRNFRENSEKLRKFWKNSDNFGKRSEIFRE